MRLLWEVGAEAGVQLRRPYVETMPVALPLALLVRHVVSCQVQPTVVPALLAFRLRHAAAALTGQFWELLQLLA